MNIILFGARGLLGRALQRVLAAEDLTAVDREELDVTDEAALEAYCAKAKPEVIINAAAYNAVDEAEVSPTAAREAFAVNAYAAQGLARAALRRGSRFVHFSTDYVFDGHKTTPYSEDDEPRPLSVYGRSKLEGEELILRLSERNLSYYLIRTSRLYGPASGEGKGKKTFVDIVLDRAALGGELQFIDGEEVASPTYVFDLAIAVYDMLQTRALSGIYHRTNDGGCSWYEFAKAVLDESGIYTTEPNVVGKRFVSVRPIRAADIKRPASRPRYSVLGSTKLPPLRPWREALREYLVHIG